jgi:SpoVK/Ycf46/Vps4 family AAA+-type ATPase
VVDSLNASTIALNEALEGDLLVNRECFAEFRARMVFVRDDKQNPCVLVYGPPGCGKTSVVQAAMQVRCGIDVRSWSMYEQGLDVRILMQLLYLS